MAVQIQDSWIPVDVGDIHKFEKQIGMSLPQEYASFLLTTNGGSNADRMLAGEGWVDQFYGLNVAFAYADLRWKYDIFVAQRRMPLSCLPIACDPGGNQYVIVCRGKRQGQIWFWDHENEPDADEAEEDMFDRMSMNGKSFAKFLAGMRTEKTECDMPDPAFRAVELGDLKSLRRMIKGGLSIDYRGVEDHLHDRTLLGHAIYHGRLEIMRYLIAEGADKMLTDDRGEPPIFQSCVGWQSSDALNVLLDAGVSPNTCAADGTPLIVHAAEKCAGLTMTWLLQRGDLDVNATNGAGKTAIQIAEESDETNMVRLLQRVE